MLIILSRKQKNPLHPNYHVTKSAHAHIPPWQLRIKPEAQPRPRGGENLFSQPRKYKATNSKIYLAALSRVDRKKSKARRACCGNEWETLSLPPNSYPASELLQQWVMESLFVYLPSRCRAPRACARPITIFTAGNFQGNINLRCARENSPLPLLLLNCVYWYSAVGVRNFINFQSPVRIAATGNGLNYLLPRWLAAMRVGKHVFVGDSCGF